MCILLRLKNICDLWRAPSFLERKQQLPISLHTNYVISEAELLECVGICFGCFPYKYLPLWPTPSVWEQTVSTACTSAPTVWEQMMCFSKNV